LALAVFYHDNEQFYQHYLQRAQDRDPDHFEENIALLVDVFINDPAGREREYVPVAKLTESQNLHGMRHGCCSLM